MSLKDIEKKIIDSYQAIPEITHLDQSSLPSWTKTKTILSLIKKITFPGFFEEMPVTQKTMPSVIGGHLSILSKVLEGELQKSIRFQTTEWTPKDASIITSEFLSYIPELRRLLKEDMDAIFMGDPAAANHAEIVLSYQGFRAITIYRIAHFFELKKTPLIPRIMSEIAHSETGIEIHPGAKIGTHFCIDHGSGIVIGSTTTIGNNVKIYQGVTLGALSVPDRNTNGKRHPTIEENVTIYAGATILGGNTIIGHDTTIGGNVWITKSIPHHSKIFMTSNRKQVELSSDPQI